MSNLKQMKAGIAVVFVALVAYMVVDPMLSREVFTTEPKRLFPVLALLGIVASALCVWILRRAESPAGEATMVGVMLGLTIGAAGYPTALHLNRLLDGAGLKSYEYRVVLAEPVVFEPVESGLPKIDYFKRTAYWERMGSDARITVKLRRGAFGFWQFNIDDIVTDIRRFQRGEKPQLGVTPPAPAGDAPKP
ncbi:MAG: hypothetical protein A2140_01395 [Candidatus Muproteobacteria bacterium RBG_16_62_13]|uniref:Uncharacterized protein n=1 Tax=Candidatus Muproteobacteria bacterium RBG_16_62_13 TaxID=1817756 RepID=A0A1F6T4X6_9PROT|nr:MAG: hypothetical protein A2140_01395 [Candidatus Muproteobacteria bacterium RBG_16_62_13]